MKNMESMPKFIFCVGIPGSGKSYWAETHKNELNAVIHSSDTIREELGDVNNQSKNQKVFEILHKRVKDDLKAGKNVLYDATNLNRRRRMAFLREIQNIPCEKICVLFATPFEICCKNNAKRERKVPEEVLDRMYRSFEIPCKQEGWNGIQIVWWDYKKDKMKFNYAESIYDWSRVKHDNPHHSLSIGCHMLTAANLLLKEKCDRINLLYTALKLHDCGKIYTKKFVDSKGHPSETAHFFDHQNVGAYLSLFYLKEMGYTDEDIFYISLLINLHMKPFLSWNQSKKAEEKDRRLFGDEVINDVMLIHKYDVAAH